jgi:hypothetical protein
LAFSSQGGDPKSEALRCELRDAEQFDSRLCYTSHARQLTVGVATVTAGAREQEDYSEGDGVQEHEGHDSRRRAEAPEDAGGVDVFSGW